MKDPVGANYPFGRVSELYTNQIAPYYRAPHLLLGFPTRYIDRGWTESAKALPRYEYRQIRAKGSPREGTAVTDGMFITSRDRKLFSVWPESFVRPGPPHARQLVLRRHVPELGLGRDEVGHRGRAVRVVAVRDRTHFAGNRRRAPALQPAHRRVRLAARSVSRRRAADKTHHVCREPVEPERLDIGRRFGADRDPEHATAKPYPALR